MPYKNKADRVICSKRYRKKFGKIIWHRWKNRNYVNYRLNDKRKYCNKNGIEFNLTEEWFLAQFSQGCEMTGKDFELDVGPWSAHIDRIDNNKGYTMDNCRIVCKIYNIAKNVWTDAIVDEFVLLRANLK